MVSVYSDDLNSFLIKIAALVQLVFQPEKIGRTIFDINNITNLMTETLSNKQLNK